MKVLCFTDSLGSGGAQRQLTTLAVGLKGRGHDVQFLVYLPEDHFRPCLDSAKIECHYIEGTGHLRRMLRVRQTINEIKPDVVLAFLEGPALYAELAALPCRGFGLVVGERLAEPGLVRGKGYFIRRFHCLADAVVTNSHTSRLMLEAAFPKLKKKLVTIYNGVDLNRFRSNLTHSIGPSSRGPMRIVIASSYQAKKNMENVAHALHLLQNGYERSPVVVDWYGGPAADPSPLKAAQRFVAQHGLLDCLRFHRPKKDIEIEFSNASGVGLFSFYEGLPNVVCEGMACQRPIVMSDVCDAGGLVVDGENGFLCDPASPMSIAQAFRRLASTSSEQREKMGSASRRKAETLFAKDTILKCYEMVLEAALVRRPPPENSTWPTRVPESAFRTLERWKAC